MLISTRRRILAVDRIMKRERWRSIALVGVSDDEATKALLAFHRQMRITVVFSADPAASRDRRTREAACLHRLRQWASVQQRLTLMEANAEEAAASEAGFDGVVLLGVRPVDLPTVGGLWAARVNDGGMLMGVGHELPAVRAMLTAAVPGWRALPNGLWCVKVRRDDSAQDSFVVGDDPAIASVPDSKDVIAIPAFVDPHDAPTEIAQVLELGQVIHDPVHSRPDVDDAVHEVAPMVAEAEGEVIVSSEIASLSAKRRGRPPGSKNRAPSVAPARGRKAASA